MPDLASFLTARLDEDEAAARSAADFYDELIAEDCVWRGEEGMDGNGFTKVWLVPHLGLIHDPASGRHIVRHSPARVVGDVAAKRAILALHAPIASDVSPVGELLCEAETVGDNHYHSTPWPCDTLKHLATVYASHPDYDESWRLDA